VPVRRLMLNIATEYSSIFLVAVGVAVVSTLGIAFLQGANQVGAEEVEVQETAAVPGPDGMQTLVIKDWGVRVEVPLADAMPAVKYARQSDSSVGISSADLEKAGPECRAGRNGLGAIIRVPAGTFAAFSEKTTNVQFIKTVGQYDYGYGAPGGTCVSLNTGQIINRERSVLTEALSSLAPFGE
jgi:hypothetical protein